MSRLIASSYLPRETSNPASCASESSRCETTSWFFSSSASRFSGATPAASYNSSSSAKCFAYLGVAATASSSCAIALSSERPDVRCHHAMARLRCTIGIDGSIAAAASHAFAASAGCQSYSRLPR